MLHGFAFVYITGCNIYAPECQTLGWAQTSCPLVSDIAEKMSDVYLSLNVTWYCAPKQEWNNQYIVPALAEFVHAPIQRQWC